MKCKLNRPSCWITPQELKWWHSERYSCAFPCKHTDFFVSQLRLWAGWASEGKLGFTPGLPTHGGVTCPPAWVGSRSLHLRTNQAAQKWLQQPHRSVCLHGETKKVTNLWISTDAKHRRRSEKSDETKQTNKICISGETKCLTGKENVQEHFTEQRLCKVQTLKPSVVVKVSSLFTSHQVKLLVSLQLMDFCLHL